MLLIIRYSFYILLLLPLITLSNESESTSTPLVNSKITWVIEDTFEWQSYVNKTPTATSNETGTIIINGLMNLGYQLNLIKATGDRANKMMLAEDNVCMSCRIKTPSREALYYFSEPHDLYLGQQLYRVGQSTPINANVLNQQGELISLQSLFSQYPDNILATASGISFGVELDEQIAKLSPNNVFRRSGATRVKSLVQMLFKKRVDYIIYYPQEIQKLNEDDIKLDSYPIAGSPPFYLGHVTCAKTPKGREIINHINEILKESQQCNEFYDAHEKWLSTGDIPKLRKYFLEVFDYLPDDIPNKAKPN